MGSVRDDGDLLADPSVPHRGATSRLGGVPVDIDSLGVAVPPARQMLLLDEPEPPRPVAEVLPGVVHVPDWLDADEQHSLVREFREWARPPAGLRHPRVPTGHVMSTMAVCLGWHWSPYAYSRTVDDTDGAPVTPMPASVDALARRAVAETYGPESPEMADYEPDAGIVNLYPPGAHLGLHQDGEEPSTSPVVTISLGDTCTFRLAGVDRRTGPFTDVELRSGDLLVFGRENRRIFHGVPKVFDGTAPEGLGLPPGRLSVTVRETGWVEDAPERPAIGQHGGVAEAAGTRTNDDRLARIGRTIVRIPVDYCVSICVYLAPIVATLIARRVLGDDATTEQIRRLGYGWPALEAGRWWTPVTGAVVDSSLAIPFIPGYTLFAMVLLEHRAKHWRTAVTVVVGQVGGVLLGLLVTAPLRRGTSAFAVEMTTTIDFGISVGGFACLGVWTGYLSASWRRPLRWGVSCYLAGQLLFSGLIFDVSHPMGWALGVVGGTWLMRPQLLDRSRMRLPADALWIAVAVVLGAAVGIVAGWNGGGPGGIFGWGPGR